VFIEGYFIYPEIFFCITEKTDEWFSDGAGAYYMDNIAICHKFILPKVGALNLF
jgi:hypothetical protein